MRGRLRVFWEVVSRARFAPAVGVRPLALAVGAPALVLLAGCGGGSRQDAGEKEASYHVKVLASSFPSKQAIAKPARMTLLVRNTGSTAVPNLAVTVDSFNYASNYPELASSKRPIWVIEQGPGAVASSPVESQEISAPGGGQTAYVNTWALGPLPAGRTQTFTWKVMPVKAGVHTVKFTVAAGLTGKARALLASGGPASGSFVANIAAAPPASHVDPKTGKVVVGVYPSAGATP